MIRGTSTTSRSTTQTAKVQARHAHLPTGRRSPPGSGWRAHDVAALKDARTSCRDRRRQQKPGRPPDLAGASTATAVLMPSRLQQAPQAVFVLVTNPCDVLTAAAQQITGPPYPADDSAPAPCWTSRLRWPLGNEAQVNTSSVHAYIIGEHGQSEFPARSSASICQVPASASGGGRAPSVHPGAPVELKDQVVNAAYRVIEGRRHQLRHRPGRCADRPGRAQDQQAAPPVSTVPGRLLRR
ncbi:L-lactate dehydrogenase [Kocuria rhizophila]|nr:L-lactate dehydrogenase [Kocuria rhizophila]